MEMTLEKVPHIAKIILEKARTLSSDTALVITLQGDLGAGKTTLTQEIAKQLGIRDTVISPTFVVMKKYEIRDSLFTHLVHIDAYRLEKSEELEKLGWSELTHNAQNLILLEWPEHVPKCIPEHAYRITISHKDDLTRIISL